MFTRHLQINNHGRHRNDPLYSIDLVTNDGYFINQEAFYYKTRAAALVEVARIISEDALQGRETILLEGSIKFYHRNPN